MFAERREHARNPGPFEGEWAGTSGPHACRIANLSPGGCFVDSAAAPEPGAEIAVTVSFGGTRFTLPAAVVYLDAVRGFGARFLPSDQARALAYAMGPTAPEGYDRSS